MSWTDEENYKRNETGSFTDFSHLGDTQSQFAAGVNQYDTLATAEYKIRQHQERQRSSSSLESTAPIQYSGTGPSISLGGLIGKLTLLGVVLGLIASLVAAWFWVSNNRMTIPFMMETWATKVAYGGQEFAPFSSYERLVSRNSEMLSLPPNELAAALANTREKSMADPTRFALGAAAWKCISENHTRCFEEMDSVAPQGAIMTLGAGIEFLHAAGDRGNPDAAADAGLAFIIAPEMVASRFQALEEWEKGLKSVPDSSRLQELISISKDALSFRLAGWVESVLIK